MERSQSKGSVNFVVYSIFLHFDIAKIAMLDAKFKFCLWSVNTEQCCYTLGSVILVLWFCQEGRLQQK